MTAIPAARAFRVFLEHRGHIRRVCTVFAGKDGSVYLWPNRDAADELYFAGLGRFSPGDRQSVIHFRNGRKAKGTPKVSVHASGQVHVRDQQGTVAGPLWIPRPGNHPRLHVGTIQPHCIDALPLSERSPSTKESSSEHVWTIQASPDFQNCRLVLQVGSESSFPNDYFVRQITAPLLARPVFMGACVREMEPFQDADPRGVTLLAGMDPGAKIDDRSLFLWITSQPPGSKPEATAIDVDRATAADDVEC